MFDDTIQKFKVSKTEITTYIILKKAYRFTYLLAHYKTRVNITFVHLHTCSTSRQAKLPLALSAAGINTIEHSPNPLGHCLSHFFVGTKVQFALNRLIYT